MNERQAREATLLEAFETAPAASPSWRDDDRRWADRVALEAVGSTAAAPVFIAERARHAMHRLLPRERVAARWLERPSRFGAWVAATVVVAAVLGLLADPIGASQRINLLAPPFWGLLLWNLAVYALLLGGALAALVRRRPSKPGPLRRAAAALLGVGQRMVAPAAGSPARRLRNAWLGAGRTSAAATATGPAPTPPLARFAALWSARTAPLASLRAQTLLHAGAAALAAGLVAGLYLRGLLLDYRVGWESTFLSAPTVHNVLATALAPASALAGIALPDEAGFAALQTLPDGRSAGAPAAPWIHLLAITMALVVIGPRIGLALACSARMRWLARRFALPWGEPYFQRLARLQRGAAAAVEVFPYAHTPTPQAALGLQALVSEAFGPKASVRIAPTIAFGAEDDAAMAAAVGAGATHVLMLCDLAATPESETHGRCAAHLVQRLPDGALFALIVDEASFRRRFAGLRERLLQRRAAWSELAARVGSRAAFADLESPLDADAAAALQAAFVDTPATQ